MGETGREKSNGTKPQRLEIVQEHLYKVLVIGDFGVGTDRVSRLWIASH